MIVAIIALVVALGGTSYAALKLPKNSVGTRQIKGNAVTTAKLKGSSVTSGKVKNGSLAAADFKPGQLNAKGPAGGALAGTYPNPGLAPVPAVRALSTATQSVPDSSGTIMTLSGTTFDEGAMFDNAQDALVVVEPGIYSVSGNLGWAGNATGSRQARIVINDQIWGFVVEAPGNSGFFRQSVTAIKRLDAGDVIQLGGFQSSGAPLDTSSATPSGAVWLAAFRVGS
jgi:hypothetical protein